MITSSRLCSCTEELLVLNRTWRPIKHNDLKKAEEQLCLDVNMLFKGVGLKQNCGRREPAELTLVKSGKKKNNNVAAGKTDRVSGTCTNPEMISFPISHQLLTLQQLCTATRRSWCHDNTLSLPLLKHSVYDCVEKKQGTSDKMCVGLGFFLEGLEQTRFCGTLGNRSGRLSSRKLWANINEAFTLEKTGRKRGHTWGFQKTAL